jgi:CarD family transcriptional regulator
MKTAQTYSERDWIVHPQYGLGQIQDIEVKSISGQEKRYYRVKTSNGVYWLPTDQIDGDAVRPLSTPDEIREAIRALQREPQELSANYKLRQNRIHTVRQRNAPRANARLIRDLRARRRKKGMLNMTERHAFEDLKKQFVEEWAQVAGLKTDQVKSTLNRILAL